VEAVFAPDVADAEAGAGVIEPLPGGIGFGCVPELKLPEHALNAATIAKITMPLDASGSFDTSG